MIPVWAVILVKPFDAAKQRLGDVLGAGERSQLARVMLEDVLDTVTGCGALLAGVIVVTPDRQAAALSRQRGAHVIVEETAAGMNSALQRAVDWLATAPDAALLVIPSDLPQISTAAIARVVQLLAARRAVVLVRAADGGTNLLACRPAGVIPPSFGPGSFRLHSQAAATAGIAAVTLADADLGRDLDWPQDLVAYLSRRSVSRTSAYLSGLDLERRIARAVDSGAAGAPKSKHPQPSEVRT